MATPTRKENIQTALDNIAARIAEMTVAPKPNYSIDGRSYSWGSLFDSLIAQQEKLEEALQRVDGPFEVTTYPIGS